MKIVILMMSMLIGFKAYPIDLMPVVDTKIKSPDETKTVDVVTPDGKNRLAVDTYISQISSSGLATLNSKLRYDDMNASTGGIARGTAVGTSWTAIYSYTGTGIVHGFVANLETKDKWRIRFIVDGEEVFGSDGIYSNDFVTDSLYDLDNPALEGYSGLGINYGEHDKLIYNGPNQYGTRFNSSVQILVRRDDGTKKFLAGLMVISKGL